MTETIYKQGRIINGDCLDIMDKLIEEGITVDCVITDLPYGTTACQWDSVIPFEPMWDKLNKLIKDTGVICLFSQEPFTSKLISSNLKDFRYKQIWVKNKTTGFPMANYRPLKCYEEINIFSKSPTNYVSFGKGKPSSCYYPQGLLEVNKKVKPVKVDNEVVISGLPLKQRNIQKYTNYPKDVIYFDKENKTIHKTQKPTKLLEYLVKTYTKENELILDITAGSMSLAHACVNTNRKFICIEKDEHYYNVGVNRINNCIEAIKDEP